MVDHRKLRPCRKVVLKLLDVLRGPFSQRLNSSIWQITHITDNLMTRRSPLREEAIANSLNLTPYQKLPRHFRHRYRQSKLTCI